MKLQSAASCAGILGAGSVKKARALCSQSLTQRILQLLKRDSSRAWQRKASRRAQGLGSCRHLRRLQQVVRLGSWNLLDNWTGTESHVESRPPWAELTEVPSENDIQERSEALSGV